MISEFESYREFIPEFQGFIDSIKKPMPVHIRVNSLKVSPSGLVTMLDERGIRLEPSIQGNDCLYEAPALKSPGSLMEYLLGYIHPQALTSCLTSIALSPEPSGYVLDMCAAPGGKTSHLAQIMNNNGLIVANELYGSRHIPLAHILSRLGVMNTVMTAYQGQEFPLNQRFDYVLADVPCSGEGRVRYVEGHDGRHDPSKNPRMYNLINTQKRMILRGYDLLKEEGIMLYSTCTYNPEENEGIVDYLIENRHAVLLPINAGVDFERGLTHWRDKRYNGQLERAARFYPHRIDSVGFFMARIGKGRQA